jgi:peptide-methionine (S)-S-oxide reductase
MNDRHETAIFGAGCFWGVEEAFRRIEGVVDTTVGYAGGHTANPSYREVCSGRTGHAEVVRVAFDPARVSYRELLEAFWSLHDPTQVNRQGPDVGSQYRSLILVGSPEQEAAARESRSALESSRQFPGRIATEIEEAGPFWTAEEDHQRYLEKRGMWSCHTR